MRDPAAYATGCRDCQATHGGHSPAATHGRETVDQVLEVGQLSVSYLPRHLCEPLGKDGGERRHILLAVPLRRFH
jgi:hypothetical protein